MQMEQWQDAASQQVKLLTTRLNELLSKGLQLLRSEFGVDLGLKPELIPPWVILLAACTGLVLMVVLWASVCRTLFKKRPTVSPVDDGIEIKRGVSKPVKSEEPKKKKKKAEKKAQPNGRAVAEPQEEAIVSEEIVPHHQPLPPEVKAEKVAEVKKSKKKAKQAVKEAKTVTADGKEPEEGTWETKVSNKERREQRKKDKSSSDGSASPGGGDTPVSTPPEQPKASAAPANQKKKKGESAKVKAEKVEAAVSQVNNREVAAKTAGVTDMAVKVPAHSVAPKSGPWTTSREPVSLWRADIDESWTVIDRAMPTTELNLSFTGLGVGAAEPHPVSELPWLSQPRVDDEWSGLNGGSVDPSSDWNAPSEAWGNYEEPTPVAPPAPEQPLPEPAKVNLLIRAADNDEDEKDKGETASDGTSKTKKKKKKKKKAAEEGGATGQGEEPEKEAAPAASVKKQPPGQENVAAIQPVKAAAVEARVERQVKDNISSKPPVTQVPQKPVDGEPTAKQNSLPAPVQQKKPEESQAPKPAKKKKARRET
ncbi:protein LYRIC-like isoform X1 [Seriola lalandi dorsalis]|uniref:protein LYRIC-like isoform X1 n=1 Tax=Seriola lalandi dorsalis TaxID=1841481 RepID=UPI000C6FB58F|nr:protein LYRIC-like isoform X1 [Seriola lalandi dorsalis]